MLTIAPCLTTTPALVGRVIMCFKASMGPGVHTVRSDVRSLAFVEEYWRLPPQSADPLCSEFGCVRLYSTIPKVYYVIDTWRILGPAPIIRNPVHPTIPHGTLPKSQAQRKREYPDAKEDSKNGGDGSPQWIVNMWAMMWGSKRPSASEPRTGSHKSAVYWDYHGLHGEWWRLCHKIRQVVWHSSQCVTRWWVENSVPPQTSMYAYWSSPKMGDNCHWCDDIELCSRAGRGTWWNAMQHSGRVAL